jgi:hypothetical protein
MVRGGARQAIETASVAFAPKFDLFSVPSRSINFLSTAA